MTWRAESERGDYKVGPIDLSIEVLFWFNIPIELVRTCLEGLHYIFVVRILFLVIYVNLIYIFSLKFSIKNK